MGNHNLPNTRAVKKTGQLLDCVGLPVIKETEAAAKDGVATAWGVSKGQPRSHVLERVAVRLALIAQSQDERKILTQAHFVLQEGIGQHYIALPCEKPNTARHIQDPPCWRLSRSKYQLVDALLELLL